MKNQQADTEKIKIISLETSWPHLCIIIQTKIPRTFF